MHCPFPIEYVCGMPRVTCHRDPISCQRSGGMGSRDYFTGGESAVYVYYYTERSKMAEELEDSLPELTGFYPLFVYSVWRVIALLRK